MRRGGRSSRSCSRGAPWPLCVSLRRGVVASQTPPWARKWRACQGFVVRLKGSHGPAGRVNCCLDSPISADSTRTRLATRAEVRRAIHERRAPDRRGAPGAWPALPAVDLQRAVEIAALTVDVDVKRIERRAALPEGR